MPRKMRMSVILLRRPETICINWTLNGIESGILFATRFILESRGGKNQVLGYHAARNGSTPCGIPAVPSPVSHSRPSQTNGT